MEIQGMFRNIFCDCARRERNISSLVVSLFLECSPGVYGSALSYAILSGGDCIQFS